MTKVPYIKPALTYAAQLSQLKDRGLIIIYLMISRREPHSIQDEVKELLSKYSQVHSAAMGFPNDWESEPLWK